MGGCIPYEDEFMKSLKNLGKTDTFKSEICDGKIPIQAEPQCCEHLAKNII